MKLIKFIVPSLLLPFASCSQEEDQYIMCPTNIIPKVIARQSSLKILAIGNSFTEDATRYMPALLNEFHENDIYFAILTHGGASLRYHWDNLLNGQSEYTFKYCLSGNWVSGDFKTVNKALSLTDWDIIVFQQVSDDSGKYDTFQPYLDNLIQAAKSGGADPLIAWHMTWAYASKSGHPSFADYGNDRARMYNEIENALSSLLQDNVEIDIVIPSGKLIEDWRNSEYNTSYDLTRDGYHLDTGTPCLILSKLWHEILITPHTHISTLDKNTIRIQNYTNQLSLYNHIN